MFHGKEGEAWTDWLAGWQRIHPPSIPGEPFVQEAERCQLKPPEASICPRSGSAHGTTPGCECVLFRGQHRRHRALCGAVWEA